MLRSVLCSLAAIAVFAGLAVGVAHAQDSGPNTVACREAKDARKAQKAVVEAARIELNQIPKLLPDGVVNPAREPAERELDRVKLILVSLEATEATRCAAPATTTPPPPSTTPPPPSTTPPPSTSPAPKDEFDCPDFPLSDGRTAQQVLDADRSDPHNLDRDKDGKACEVDEGAPPVVLLPVPVACNDLRTRQDLDREALRQVIRRINDLNNTYRTTPKLTDEQVRLIREAYGSFDTRASSWRRLIDERRLVCRDNGGDTRIDVTINEAPAPVRSVVGSSSGSSSSLPRGGVETGGI